MSLFHRILVAVDGSDPSNAAVALAVQLAADERSELVFCHAVDVVADYREASEAQMIGGAQDLVTEDKAEGAKIIAAAAQSARDAHVNAGGRILEGNPPHAIAQYARDGGFDLIVTGTHGHHGFRRLFLGSTAEGILRRSSVPVLAVRPASSRSSSG